jgi:hypothetical protein
MAFKVLYNQVLDLLLIGRRGFEHEAVAGHIHIKNISYFDLERILSDSRPPADFDFFSSKLMEESGLAHIGSADQNNLLGHDIKREGKLEKDDSPKRQMQMEM